MHREASRPEHTAARQQLIALLERDGQHADALHVLDAGPRNDPALQLARVHALLAADRREEAVTLLNQAQEACEALMREPLGVHRGTYVSTGS